MIVDEFITLLSLDVKGMKKGEAFKAKLDEIERTSKEVIIGISAMIAGITAAAAATAKMITDNYEWAKSTGVATDSYQRFQHAAAMVGGELNDIKGDLEGWVRSAKASGKTLEQVFMDEAKAIEGMAAEESRAFLTARGYSETSIRLIQQGTGKLQEFFASAEIIPEGDLKAAQDYTVTWRQTISQLTRVFQSAVASAMPILQDVLKSVREFIEANKHIVQSSIAAFFKVFAAAAKGVFSVLVPLVDYLIRFVGWLDKITNGWSSSILIWTAATAVIIAFTVAMVNAAVAFFTQYIPATMAAVVTMGKFIASLVASAAHFIAGLIPAIISGTVATWNFLASLVPTITTFISGLIPAMIAATVAAWNFTAALLANPITWIVLAIVALIAAIVLLIVYWDEIVDAVKAAWDAIVDFAVGTWNKIKELGQKISDFFAGIWDSAKDAAIDFWNFLAGLITSQINMCIRVLNALIRGINKIPGMNIPLLDEVDWTVKPRKKAPAKSATLSQNATATGSLNKEQQSVGNYVQEHNLSSGNSVPIAPTAVATASPGQVVNNSRTNNYTDNRTITIETTATSAPALKNTLQGTNVLTANGYGQGGVR